MPKLVKFQNPPLIEVVMGIQFESEIFSEKKIFEIYSKLFEDDFPTLEMQSLLPTNIEKEEPEQQSQQVLAFSNGSNRKFFISANGQKLLQIQGNRLVFNWRTVEGGEDYPDYENVFVHFYKIVKQIDGVIPIFDSINQYEITYVDHARVSDFETSYFSISSMFNQFNLEHNLRTVGCDYSVWKVEIGGNLHVKYQSAFRTASREKVIVVESTCRGYIQGSLDFKGWFDAAHKILIEEFVNSLTEEAKKIWKIQQ